MTNTTGNLGIELGTTLQLQFVGLRESAKTTLVGMERNSYLIARSPQISGIWTKLHKENHVIVRYLYEGMVYGFKCTLLGIIDEPFRLMLLSYPEHIETVNLRKQERVSCFLPAKLINNNIDYAGVILDISAGGCNFFFDLSDHEGLPDIKVGDDVKFSLHIGGSSGVTTVQATVRNLRSGGDKITIGAQFLNVDIETLSNLETYINIVTRSKTYR